MIRSRKIRLGRANTVVLKESIAVFRGTTRALVCGTMTVHIIGVPWHSFNKDRLLHTVVIFGAFFGLMLIHDMLQAPAAACRSAA